MCVEARHGKGPRRQGPTMPGPFWRALHCLGLGSGSGLGSGLGHEAASRLDSTRVGMLRNHCAPGPAGPRLADSDDEMQCTYAFLHSAAQSSGAPTTGSY